MVYLTLDGEIIETTFEHPFLLDSEEWVVAGELQVGDVIEQGNGETGVVEGIQFSLAPQLMYNLTVAEAHTYVVGEGQWVVHNECKIHWPSKPHGVPKHWQKIKDIVQNMVDADQYTDIYVNKSITTATDGSVKSRLRPDITGKTKDGKYVLYEIVSPTQTAIQLKLKVNRMKKLFGTLWKEGNVLYP